MPETVQESCSAYLKIHIERFFKRRYMIFRCSHIFRTYIQYKTCSALSACTRCETSIFSNSSASCVTGLKAAKADDAKKDDDENHCLICMDDITDKKELPCKHKFCRECIDEYFSKGQPKCPSCGKVFGTLRGDQPKGTMTWRVNTWQNLPGYNDCGIIEIDYSFNDGRQGVSMAADIFKSTMYITHMYINMRICGIGF